MAKKIKIKGEDGKKSLEIEIGDAPTGSGGGGGMKEPDVQAYQDSESITIISNGKILTITIAE